MRALAEAAFHAGGKANCGLAELVAQMIGCGQSSLPAVVAGRFEQIELRRSRFEIRCLHSEQPHERAFFPIAQKEPPRLFCIFGKCTHLGCTPDWKPAENKFKCPCHGSGYTPEGINFEGPAPRPMDRAHVELNAQGEIIVDTSRLYSWFKAQGGPDRFDDPGSFINV